MLISSGFLLISKGIGELLALSVFLEVECRGLWVFEGFCGFCETGGVTLGLVILWCF